ncbi:Uncharacterised protein [Collinsella aerofaciens]|nr:Uncharacterised protein [Collinsella aerofaciens]
MNPSECRLPKTHKEIVRIMVFSIPYLKDGQATSNTKARAPLPGFSRVIWDEWGKKGVRMDTKALKKQMGAAIAMVLVAAVALGSATFAWFVTNNTVTANTNTISAQSNAAFMTIKYNGTAVGVDSTEDTATDNVGKALYPATFGENPTDAAPKGKFAYGYGQKVTADGYMVNSEGLKLVNGTGSLADAVTGEYAVKEVFNISSRGQDLKKLRVHGVTAGETTSESKLNSALRVLVYVDDTHWEVYDVNGTFKYGSGAAAGVLAEDVTHDRDTKVELYLFYEGSNDQIYTNNLTQLTSTKNITVQFEADAQNK